MNLWSKPGLGQITPKSCGSFPKLGVPFGGPLQKDYSNYFGVFVGVPLFRETTMYCILRRICRSGQWVHDAITPDACCADLVNKPKDAQPVLSSDYPNIITPI